MFEWPGPVRVAALTRGLQAVSHELTTPGSASSTDTELLDLLRDAEVARRKLAVFDQVLIAGTTHRFYAKTQRFAVMARDKRCTWPGCDAPPARCEINHVIRWENGGKTSIATGAAMCDRDHDNLDTNGWIPTMINGIPHYIPPPWIDPDQVPQRTPPSTTCDHNTALRKTPARARVAPVTWSLDTPVMSSAEADSGAILPRVVGRFLSRVVAPSHPVYLYLVWGCLAVLLACVAVGVLRSCAARGAWTGKHEVPVVTDTDA